MTEDAEELWIRHLLDVGRALTKELDQRVVLDRVLETAREITGARYAALGILNEQRSELEQFLTLGVDEETQRTIGELPRGRGVLGTPIEMAYVRHLRWKTRQSRCSSTANPPQRAKAPVFTGF